MEEPNIQEPKMFVSVTVRLQDRGNKTINLANGLRYEVGTFKEAARILDKIVKFLGEIPGAKRTEY